MKKYSFVIVAFVLFVTACKQGSKTIHLNEDASFTLADTLPENPLLEKVLTAAIDTKDSTMATLYANKTAWEYAIAHEDANYPAGAVLYQVTWKQKPDSVWFGANIPKTIHTIERISYTSNSPANYELYEGRPLRKSKATPDTARIAWITGQKMAIAP